MTDGGRGGDSKYRSAARHRAAWRRPESHRTTPAAPCADLCQQLLSKGVNRPFNCGLLSSHFLTFLALHLARR